MLQAVEALANFDITVRGVIDRDVMAEPVPTHLDDKVVQWPLSDIEAMMISDAVVLEEMRQRDLLISGLSVAEANTMILEAAATLEENAVAEVAQRLLRARRPDRYPSPRGSRPLERLRIAYCSSAGEAYLLSEFEEAVAAAQERVHAAEHPMLYVRGKDVLNSVISRLTPMRDARSLLLATANALSDVPAMMRPALTRLSSD